MDHLTTAELEARLDEVRESPDDGGTLELIVQRPEVDVRVVLADGELNPEEGLAGDSWNQRSSNRTEDGGPHPDMQLNIINSRFLAMVAQSDERMPLAGDQLVVDLDISEANLPAWTKLSIGDAIIEVTDQPHTGCAKFTQRFGLDAQRFANSELGSKMKLRGINARVITPGRIRQGDTITKL
jgi:MOSC domain-containing protein YiiM